MEFEGQYLTYEEYKALGGTLDLMPFNIAEKKARKLVDERTYSRLKKIENQVQDVKMCIFELIPITKDSYTDIQGNKNISSETIDGYNVTYKNKTIDDEKIKDNEIKSIIVRWLDECKLEDGTPYLYKG